MLRLIAAITPLFAALILRHATLRHGRDAMPLIRHADTMLHADAA